MRNKTIDMLRALTMMLIVGRGGLSAQLCCDSALQRQVLESSLVHASLPLNTAKSFETYNLKKAVLRTLPLLASDGDTLRLAYKTQPEQRATGSPSDPDYAIYGRATVEVPFDGVNWTGYNRLAFDVFPDCDGARVTNVNVEVVNRRYDPSTGFNRPSGSHLINLENRKWNRCTLEIDEYQRDEIVTLRFYTDIKGRDRSTGENADYMITGLCLQQVEKPTKVMGWEPAPDVIAYSTTGYTPESRKFAIVEGAKTGHFSVRDVRTGEAVLSRPISTQQSTLGTFGMLDFTDLTATGRYVLDVNGVATDTFRIHPRLWDDSLWRVLNFIYGQRCGHPVAGKHGACHFDLFSVHNGVSIPFHGGWHDAGDLSQQTLHTAELALSLLEASVASRRDNPALSARLREEAEWGLDFMLANRYGDGYHASSMGLLIWQDGRLGTMDDIKSVRVQNMAYDNFIYAAVSAYAAMHLGHDEAQQQKLAEVAEEDFAFAWEKFKAEGYDKFVQPYEHTFSTPPSLYRATISWAASMLFVLTGREDYARIAAEEMDYVLRCQAVKAVDGFAGFFYCDDACRVPTHWIHQSREHLYMQALAQLCATQPTHANYARWQAAVRLYGDYLKALAPFTAPYGMIPSGVYFDDEAKDKTAFERLHIFPPKDAAARYDLQLQHAVKVGRHTYVKRFPVWFNIFNGNTAVHLSSGRCAAICGRMLGDAELTDMARQQLYWTVGLNPFGQSLIYGEGSNYPQLNNFSSGESVGAIPVGIRTLGDGDEPYWPQTNNACYKEVWVVSAGKWLSLLGEVGLP